MSRRSTVISSLCAVDVHLAEELKAAVGRQVGLAGRRRLHEHHLRPEGAVERVRRPKLPAFSGPATNSQKPSKSRNAALAGS